MESRRRSVLVAHAAYAAALPFSMEAANAAYTAVIQEMERPHAPQCEEIRAAVDRAIEGTLVPEARERC